MKLWNKQLLRAWLLFAVCGAAAGEAPEEETPRVREVEATVIFRSQLPDAERCEYADCAFAAELEIAENGGERVIAIFPGFIDRKLQSAAALGAGDRIRVELIEFAALDEVLQARRTADQVEDFTLARYGAGDWEPVEAEETETGKKAEAGR